MLKIVGVGKSHFADYVKSISSPDIEMEQITPHVYSFPGIRGCDPSMVLTSQGAVFIDTAQWITQLEQMIDFAKEKCGGVKYVINTESHIDHVFGNPYLKREGATIISHEKMVDGYYKIPPAFNQTTYEYNLDLLKRQDPTQVAKLLPEGEEEIGKPDITFSDRMTLKLGDHTFQIFHTPGHSPGSVTYRVGDVLFCGDTLFAGSCGRTDFVGGSYPQILKSLKRLVSLEGNLRVCPGHEGTSSLDVERAHNPFVREALR